MSVSAYKKTQNKVEAPRVAEYRRLGELTAQLLAASKKPHDARMWAAAVLANQQFWSRLRLNVLAANTSLPEPLRLNFISLAEWVERESLQAAAGAVDFENLIAINQQIMEGLKPFTGSIEGDALKVAG